MKNKIIPCYLDITSFAGMSIGATHYYGTLKYDYEMARQYKSERVEIKHELTKKEASYLTKKDGGYGYTHEKGDMSERFDTEEQIIKIALKIWRKHFPMANILLKGDNGYAEPQFCLAGPKKIKDKINELYNRALELGGYWTEANDKDFTKICNEYWHGVLEK